MLPYFVDIPRFDEPDPNSAGEWEVNFYKSRGTPHGPPLFYLFLLNFCSVFLHSTSKWKQKVKSIIRNKPKPTNGWEDELPQRLYRQK